MRLIRACRRRALSCFISALKRNAGHGCQSVGGGQGDDLHRGSFCRLVTLLPKAARAAAADAD